MPLSDTAVRQAKPGDKGYALVDGDGLSLFVAPTGAKSWHFRFRLAGKQQRISFGTYPELTLKDARAKREEARAIVARGMDPRDVRAEPEQIEEMTFRQVADEWYEWKTPRWAHDSRKGSKQQSRRVLDNDILPKLGDRPFDQVARAEIVRVITAVEARGALNIAEKARSWVQQIFKFGIAKGYRENDPSTGIEAIAAEQPPVQHHPILAKDSIDLQLLLKRLRAYDGSPITRAAVRLMLLTMVRTIEVRRAAPGDFDLEEELWIIPPEGVKQLRGKVRKGGEDVPPYIVPLSKQAVAEVRQLLETTGRYRYAFAGRNHPDTMMSENTVNMAIKRMGFEGKLTGHGIRGTISTALYEMGYRSEWIESQLSHADPNKARAAYNHAAYVEERRGMMQAWADYLDELEQRDLSLPMPAPAAAPQSEPVATP